jgi:hypothetical protein
MKTHLEDALHAARESNLLLVAAYIDALNAGCSDEALRPIRKLLAMAAADLAGAQHLLSIPAGRAGH